MYHQSQDFGSFTESDSPDSIALQNDITLPDSTSLQPAAAAPSTAIAPRRRSKSNCCCADKAGVGNTSVITGPYGGVTTKDWTPGQGGSATFQGPYGGRGSATWTRNPGGGATINWTFTGAGGRTYTGTKTITLPAPTSPTPQQAVATGLGDVLTDLQTGDFTNLVPDLMTAIQSNLPLLLLLGAGGYFLYKKFGSGCRAEMARSRALGESWAIKRFGL